MEACYRVNIGKVNAKIETSFIFRLATESNIGRTSHSFLNRHLTKNVGGNVSNFTRKLLKLSGKTLPYSRKQAKCKNRNIFYFQACNRLQYRQDLCYKSPTKYVGSNFTRKLHFSYNQECKTKSVGGNRLQYRQDYATDSNIRQDYLELRNQLKTFWEASETLWEASSL